MIMDGVAGGGGSLVKVSNLGGSFDDPTEGLRLPRVDCRRSIPRTASMLTARSKSGGVSIPEID